MQTESTRFHIQGLPAASFAHLVGLSDDALAARNARRYVADGPGFPDRIELRDAAIGESVILVNYQHVPGDGPYRASHAVFVLEHPTQAFDAVDRILDALRTRTLSLRAFDRDDLIVEADLVEGTDVETLIDRLFARPDVVYIHAHYARRGCFACRIDRLA